LAAPEVETEERALEMPPPRTGIRASARIWLRRFWKLLLIIVAIPLVLSILYRPGFIHPVSTLMLADLVALKGYDRRWVPLEEMGQIGPISVMMSEDAKFCAHNGVDWGEMRAVLNEFLNGESPRGASTITMQTVKNLFLPIGRSYVRKLVEVPLAMYFDLIYPKRRIMEIYLNVAEWGPGIYGLEAASQHYFGRPARDLTARQAALLAVTLPNPSARNPAKPSNQLNRLANRIERRARASGAYIGCIVQESR
jgi:Membrane carboxypeptidase (penicillin-binding protein)